MLIKHPPQIANSEITDKSSYLSRREFIHAASGTAVAAAVGLGVFASKSEAAPAPHGRKFENVLKSPFSTDEAMNSWNEITTYNSEIPV